MGGPRGSATGRSDRGSAVELRSGPALSVGAGAVDACALGRGGRGGCAVSPTVPPACCLGLGRAGGLSSPASPSRHAQAGHGPPPDPQ